MSAVEHDPEPVPFTVHPHKVFT